MPTSFDTNAKSLAKRYIRLLDVNVTTTSVEKDIEENPFYPSLLSFSDTFDKYKITNEAFQIEAKDFNRLEPPFLAFIVMPTGGKDFVLVTAINDKTITYLFDTQKPNTIEKEEFLKLFLGTVWMAVPDENSKEPEFKTKREKEQTNRYKKIFWISAVGLMLLFAIVSNADMSSLVVYFSIVLLKLTGVTTTIMLLIYETDKSNAFVKSICRSGKQTNCDAVLSSSKSKIFGISWAEIGFFYFASSALWLFIPSMPFENKITYLAVANAFATPYILFSIFYQWRVVKQWCPLCLTVQGILLLEAFWAIVIFWIHKFSIPLLRTDLFSRESLTALSMVLFSIVAWYGVKPFFLKAKDSDLYRAAYKRLQNNSELFRSLLQQQEKAPDDWQHLGITVGNPEAENTIIKVCNPFCGPCAAIHPVLEDIINTQRNVRLKIIFKTFGGIGDRDALVVKHLMAVASQGSQEYTVKALDDWYLAEQKDYNAFALKYGVNEDLNKQDFKVNAMNDWCKDAEIPHTPTIYVNGYRLPENYDLKELKNII